MKIHLSSDEKSFLYSFLVDNKVPTQLYIITGNDLMLSETTANDIRELLSDNLARYFDRNYNPTATALIIESLIDKLFIN